MTTHTGIEADQEILPIAFQAPDSDSEEGRFDFGHSVTTPTPTRIVTPLRPATIASVLSRHI